MTEEKNCRECGKVLHIEDYILDKERTEIEVRAAFKKRKFCSHYCANKTSQRKYKFTHTVISVPKHVKTELRSLRYGELSSFEKVIIFLIKEHRIHRKEKEMRVYNKK